MVTEFGRIVERLRESVSAHLYRLVVMECGLMAELSHVWEVFTLARYYSLLIGQYGSRDT